MVKDRFLLKIGSFLVSLALLIPCIYQIGVKISEGNPYLETHDMQRKSTVDGYGSPEEIVEYVLYQINQGDLDLALRGCAIQEVSEYFSLQKYCEVLEDFPYRGTLAPADYDNQAYVEINSARMTVVYSSMIEQCMSMLGEEYDLEILRIETDIPEKADGFYYQEIRDISAIVGAKDVCNVVVDMLIEGIPRRMMVTAAKYKSYWKILQFSEYKNFLNIEPQISEYTEEVKTSELPVGWEDMSSAILPLNYHVANNMKIEDVEKIAKKIFVYLQRGEVWKIIAYYDIYDSEEVIYPDSVFFEKQSNAAYQIQGIYYQILMHDGDKMSWIKENVKEEAVNLTALLDATSMIYANLNNIEVIKSGENELQCRIRYTYEGQWFSSTILLVYKNGWKISEITLT